MDLLNEFSTELSTVSVDCVRVSNRLDSALGGKYNFRVTVDNGCTQRAPELSLRVPLSYG